MSDCALIGFEREAVSDPGSGIPSHVSESAWNHRRRVLRPDRCRAVVVVQMQRSMGELESPARNSGGLPPRRHRVLHLSRHQAAEAVEMQHSVVGDRWARAGPVAGAASPGTPQLSPSPTPA